MEQVGVFDAKVHLSKLVLRASRGETIVITRNGHPMAKLSPAGESRPSRPGCEEAMAVLRDIRARATSGKTVSIREWIEEGRRF